MMVVSQIEWDKKKKAFESGGYFDMEDQNGNEKCIPKMMCWDAPMSELPPEILNLIFDLRETVEKLEDRIRELEQK